MAQEPSQPLPPPANPSAALAPSPSSPRDERGRGSGGEAAPPASRLSSARRRAKAIRQQPPGAAEFQRLIAERLLDALDASEVQHLAELLLVQGLIRRTANGTLQAAPRRASRAAGERPALAAASTMESAAEEAEGVTTLILRNLPATFDQKSAQEWVDSKGYRDLYDFLLWFPAKRTSRLNTSSYAFVNFRSAEHALRFRSDFHLSRFPGEDYEEEGRRSWPLSIAVAKVQGFAENYKRFFHLADERSPTLCQPFFARDACESLPQETKASAASAAGSTPRSADGAQAGAWTTLILRNLPYTVDSSDAARAWLDAAGFAGSYDFLLFLPAKRRRPEAPASSSPQGLSYAFVNFRKAGEAQRCTEALDGRALTEGDPTLNVVAARVQGLAACLEHFSSLGHTGRLLPWVDPRARPARVYQ